MGDAIMQDDQLEAIADQVKQKMILWMEEKHIYPFPARNNDINPQLLERMVRVEEGIKHQNENLERMIQQTDRRFTDLTESMDNRFTEMNMSMNHRFAEVNETMDRRFSEVDRRFNRLYTFLSGIFLTILAGMITLIIQGFQG
ncbi:MAG: hypothetical protein PQJ58_15770 [Spirochaetales bacterium]|nr:hypothetical protein [Spirochaetales bacterium]